MLQQGWTNKYIGIPYVENGRDLSGTDCYGLARLIYKTELGVDLPSFTEQYLSSDAARVQELIAQYKEGWEPVTTPEPGDLALFRITGLQSHIAVAIDSRQFLHAQAGTGAAVETFENIKWKNRLVGFYRYKAETGVSLTAVPHPLRTIKYTTAVPPGSTVAQLAEWVVTQYGVAPELKSRITILVNTRLVPQEAWSTTVIQDGDTVEYRALPQGGNTLRLVLTLAVVIAAPQLVAAMGSIGGVAMTTTAGALTAAGSAFAAGVTMVGMLLVNAIAPVVPPKQASPGEAERQYMISGGSNQAKAYEAVPFVLGKVRFTPPLGAEAFISYGSENNARISYFNMLLCWGYGPVEIYEDTLKLGEIAITDYEVPAIKHLEGKPSETTADKDALDAIYGIDIQQEYSGLELVCDGDPGTIVTPGPWTEKATTSVADTIEVAINFPQGLRKVKSKGKNSGTNAAAPTTFSIEYKMLGSTLWNNLSTFTVGSVVVPDPGTSTPLELLAGPKQEYYKDPFTHTKTFSVAEGTLPNNTGISIRVRRETGDNAEVGEWQYVHTSVLNTVTFRRNTRPVDMPVNTKLALTALRIQATEQLTSRVEGVNAVVQSICLDWDGTSWVSRPTNNPASLFRYVLESVANPRRITDPLSKLDLVKLQYWHSYCETKGFTYNSVIGAQKSVLEVLREICAAGRASPALQDGKWSVNIDEPQLTVVQHFSPHNSWGFEAIKLLPRVPDGLRITYFDEDQDYQEAEAIVYNTNKSLETAELFESISFPGVTKLASVIDHAKWHYAQVNLRPEVYTINADFEYLVCNRGDRVKVTHDVPMWGLGSGRVKSRISSTLIDLDTEVPIEAGKHYTLRIRSTDKASLLASGGSLDSDINTTFAVTSATVSNGLATVACAAHPLQVGDTISVSTSLDSINTTQTTVLAVTGSSITYNVNAIDTPATAITGSISLGTGYYSRVSLSTPMSVDQCNFPDLYLFGEQHTESQDLIVLGIEPTTNKTARLTLTDYGVTPEYNIFTDYLSLSASTVFETQITLPPKISRDAFGDITPTITQVYSAAEAAERLSPGTWQYAIKVSYVNNGNLPYTTDSVECQYDLEVATNELNVKSLVAPYRSGVFTIRDIVEGASYKIRLRYISSTGIAGKWTPWTTHVASGFTQNQAHELTLSVDRTTRYLNVTPYISGAYVPEEFKAYELRFYKNEGTGDFWETVDPDIITVRTTSTASINLRDFTRPRLSLSGVKYRIACRMLSTSDTYISNSALTEVLLTNLI